MVQKKAIVLGGTSPHVSLAQHLHDMGYMVILVDYLANPPAKKVADKHIQASTLDKDAILQIAKDEKADLVISTCIDQANSTCCYVAEKLGLPHPYSYQTSLDVTDKGRMKQIFKKNNIPTSPFFVVQAIEQVDGHHLDYPLVVKPVDCNSSKGVRRADNREELDRYVLEALQLSRTHNAIIEQFVSGYEIQVDCMALENSAEVVMTRKKKQIKGVDNIVLQSTGSIVPAPFDAKLNEQAKEIANLIVKGFSLKNTPFFYQAIVGESGINVLEFAPRIGGGLSYRMLKDFAGVDTVKCAIQSFLGEKMMYSISEITSCYSTNLLYMHHGIFDHIEGFEKLKSEGTIYDYFVFKNQGTEIDSNMSSGNRVGGFIVKSQDYEQLAERESIAYHIIRVCDAQGNNLINKVK